MPQLADEGAQGQDVRLRRRSFGHRQTKLRDEARRSLQRVLYLDPTFVLAHFTLGNLARSRGNHNEADKHFSNSLRLLGRLEPHDLLPESDGLTAGRLTETITAMTALGATR